MVSFGDLLRQCRLASGLTQEELGEHARVSQRAISDLERGARCRPHRETVRLLVDALGLDATERAQFEIAARQSLPRSSHLHKNGMGQGDVKSQTNLPVQVTSFVGREREIAEVAEILRSARLVTLTGTGGCGKTRLALKVAPDFCKDFPDGVWFVDLAPLSNPTLVPYAIAKTLQVREDPRCAVLSTLTDYLQPRTLLLLLDNCEHLVSGCASTADALLRCCPRLTILATSREALGITAEIAWRVPSLTFPKPGDTLPTGAGVLARGRQNEAVQLFIERAAAVRSGFALTIENVCAVIRLCARLDGIPLAIELAAARATVLSPEQIATRLDDRFHLLTRGSRNALPRHQTLRALIDWSYDLLSDAEKTLAQRVSVFAGGFTLEAAEVVGSISGVERPEILDLLSELVAKSVVVASDHGSEIRYRLLETLRQYLSEKLVDSGEEDQVRDRHRDWCCDFFNALQMQSHFLGGPVSEIQFSRAIECERDNLRAALGWSLETAPEQGLGLAAKLGRLWAVHGLNSEGLFWFRTLLARAPERTATRARAVFYSTMLALDVGDYSTAVPLAEEGLSIARELRDAPGQAWSYINLGRIADSKGQTALARQKYEEAFRALGETNPDSYVLAFAQCWYALPLWRDGERDAAKRILADSLDRAQKLGDSNMVGWTLFRLAGLALDDGNLTRTRELLESSLAFFREIYDKPGLGSALGDLGYLAGLEGDTARAVTCLREGLTMLNVAGHRPRLARAIGQLAIVAMRLGDAAQGAKLLGIASTVDGFFRSCLDPVLVVHQHASEESVRATFGDVAFSEMVAAGQAMTAGAAIAYVLDEPLIELTSPA